MVSSSCALKISLNTSKLQVSACSIRLRNQLNNLLRCLISHVAFTRWSSKKISIAASSFFALLQTRWVIGSETIAWRREHSIRANSSSKLSILTLKKKLMELRLKRTMLSFHPSLCPKTLSLRLASTCFVYLQSGTIQPLNTKDAKTHYCACSLKMISK
jgi:hypothetical protein